MEFPWAIVISLGVLGLALLFKFLAGEVVEDYRIFLFIAGIFIALYILAAWAVGSLNPRMFFSSFAA